MSHLRKSLAGNPLKRGILVLSCFQQYRDDPCSLGGSDRSHLCKSLEGSPSKRGALVLSDFQQARDNLWSFAGIDRSHSGKGRECSLTNFLLRILSSLE